MSSNSNSNSNSNWRNTKIGMTARARDYDPIRQMLADPEFWNAGERSQGTSRKQFTKLLHGAVDKLVISKTHSAAMDALEPLDEQAREALSGLRFYFSQLQKNEPLNTACCRVLLKKIMQGL